MTPFDHALWSVWIGAFAARTDAYVRNSRVTVKEPLTTHVCEQALQDGDSISGYLATRDPDTGLMVTQVAAIDVDTRFEDVIGISTVLWDQGISNLKVKSRRGGHIWVWTQDEKFRPVSASTVRRALTNLVKLALVNTDHIEVFPKGHGTGALRMPLFAHPKDGTVYPVVDRDGTEVTDRQTVYDRIVDYWTPYKALQSHAGDMPYMQTASHVPESLRPSYGPLVPDGMTVSATLQAAGITNAYPGKSVRCPWHDDKHASLSIFDDDMRAMCKAPACPAHNNGRGIGSLALRRLFAGR